MAENLAERLAKVREQIRQAAEKAHRNADAIKLVAVSKTHGAETVKEAIAAGARSFGENKIQEAEGKINEVGREAAQWHLIGHLQSNKARKAVKLFDVVHSLDSCELAERLERICEEEGREKLSVFVQVDLAKETTKNGIEEKDLPELVEFLRRCKHLKFDGLMIVPPFFDDLEQVRPFFRRLREIRDEVCPRGELSMGMSHDFAVAIEEGATVIRVGTAIFGERNYRN
ncbi:MAG TPA: YggS family pyridoxal phosphate-dependent enzyme [Pyrinomonadaceae bacterium]|nr:YggS family pyridoxal phosphate-dependent enzyme [Pyrinomonadaceae bacterium]